MTSRRRIKRPVRSQTIARVTLFVTTLASLGVLAPGAVAHHRPDHRAGGPSPTPTATPAPAATPTSTPTAEPTPTPTSSPTPPLLAPPGGCEGFVLSLGWDVESWCEFQYLGGNVNIEAARLGSGFGHLKVSLLGPDGSSFASCYVEGWDGGINQVDRCSAGIKPSVPVGTILTCHVWSSIHGVYRCSELL